MKDITGTYTYIPRGVCSRKMEINLENGIIANLQVEGGCNGNLQGIVRLVCGRRADEVIDLLRGIRCESKATSCPDQLSAALVETLENLSKGGLNDD